MLGQSGIKGREENPAPKPCGGCKIRAVNADPARRTRKRRRMTEDELIEVIEDAAKAGSWNAAAWLVERRWPEHWSKTKGPIAPEATPPEPVPGDPFAEVVDLAHKRRAR
jgi:hypothetical protein